MHHDVNVVHLQYIFVFVFFEQGNEESQFKLLWTLPVTFMYLNKLIDKNKQNF